MMHKRHLFLILIAGLVATSQWAVESFESQMEAAKKAGFQTDKFSHRTETVVLKTQVLKMTFPTVSGVKSGWFSSNYTYDGETYYLSHGVQATYKSDRVDIEARFLAAGDYGLSLTFYPASGGYVSLNYKIKVTEGAAIDSYPELIKGNFPVFPTGYFYLDGLRMKNFDQQYFYNTVEKTWKLNYKGTIPEDYSWSVQRPGGYLDKNNIKTIRDGSKSTSISFDFPEEGVYQIFLYDNKYKQLARWKVRNEVPNESAKPSQKDTYFDKTRSLDLALMVQDIPFEWEFDVDTLAKNLKQGAVDEADLNEIMFDWVTQNISYDHYWIDTDEKSLIYPGLSRNVNYRKLYLHNCICALYSELSTELSQKMGLNDYYVDGPILMSPKSGQLDWSGHAWNAVKLEGEWLYYDTTWGIFRHNPKDFQSTRGIDTYRKFWTDINYPSEASNDEGLTISADKAYIEKLPYFGPYGYLFEAGISLDNLPFNNYRINTKKSFTFNLPADPGLEVSAQYAVPTSYDLKSAGTVKYANGQYNFSVSLPQNGDYRLVLSLKNPKTQKEGSLEYLVSASDTPKASAVANKKIYDFSGNYKSKSPDGDQVAFQVGQKGNDFTAKYAYHGITMTGKINQDLVVGTWKDLAGQTGWFSFRINEKGDSLDGSWGLTSGHTYGPLTATK